MEEALTKEQCRAIRDGARSLLVPTNPRNLPPKKGEAFRNNERASIEDSGFAEVSRRAWPQA
jgi:hypothetical protein